MQSRKQRHSVSQHDDKSLSRSFASVFASHNVLPIVRCLAFDDRLASPLAPFLASSLSNQWDSLVISRVAAVYPGLWVLVAQQRPTKDPVRAELMCLPWRCPLQPKNSGREQAESQAQQTMNSTAKINSCFVWRAEGASPTHSQRVCFSTPPSRVHTRGLMNWAQLLQKDSFMSCRLSVLEGKLMSLMQL